MNRRLKFWISNCVALLSCFAFAQASPTSTKSQTKPDIRTLHFPPDVSIGALYVVSRVGGLDKPGPSVAAAKGTVTLVVPPDSMVGLELGGKCFQNPALLDPLKNEPIDSLRISFYSMDDSEEGIVDKAMLHVGEMHELQELLLDRCDATDKSLEAIAGMPKLFRLSCFNAEVTGSGLGAITASCPNITDLRLWYCPIQHTNLKQLGKLKHLESLNVSSTQLKDDSIECLTTCTGLKWLRIFSNPITNKNLAKLKALKNLESLDVTGTKVTIDGLRQLKGMHLHFLSCPFAVGPNYDAELTALFPGITLHHQGPPTVKSDDLDLFAPRH